MRHKKNGRKRIGAWLAALMLLTAVPGWADGYRTLEKGATGEDVMAFKMALYELGYFSSTEFSSQYNDITAERVKQLQANNGLPETGIASPEVQELVFSGHAVPFGGVPRKADQSAEATENSETAENAPDAVQSISAQDIPARTEEGFLAPDAGMEEFVLRDAENGLWMYLSSSLAVTITEHEDRTSKHWWLEADILCTPETPLKTYLNLEEDGRSLRTAVPTDMALKNNIVLGISDDHFGTRLFSEPVLPGIIIRGGKIYQKQTYPANETMFPNLELLAVHQDGSMKTYLSNDHTAQEYLDMGVTDTFAFGPVLVTNGELGAHVQRDNYYPYNEPRMALGMLEPYHYLIVAVNGRTGIFEGATLQWLAQKMQALGAVEAINLDGGDTAALVFMGERLTTSGQYARALYGMIGFGTSDAVK